jgi:succinoglycan biosynthesis transport protein ExoP
MDLLLLVKVLWRKIWILIAIPVIAALAAFLFTLDTVETYRSVSQISTGFTVNDQVQFTDEKFNIRDADVKFSNLLTSMNSSLAINLTSYRLLLRDLSASEYPYHQPNLQTFAKSQEEAKQVSKEVEEKLRNFLPMLSSDAEDRLIIKYLKAYKYDYNTLKESLKINRIPNTDYVQVEFTADKPELAAWGANAFSEEFIRYHNSLKTERSGESVEFLKQLSDQKKTELDSKLETQKMFKSSNNLFDVAGESGVKLSQMAEFERQREEARSNMHRYELTIRRIKEDIRSFGAPVSSNNNRKVLELKEKIDRLNDRYVTGGSSNPALLDSLRLLREQFNIQVENANRQGTTLATGITLADLQSKLKDAEINYQVERDNLAIADSKIRSLQLNISGYASKESQLSAIQKEVDLASEEYKAAMEKYNQAKNRMAGATTLRQVLVAVPPVTPEMSKRFIIVGLAGFTSFAICLFVIVVLELIDSSIRTPDKFKRLVGLPLSGSVNKIDSKSFNIRAYFSQQNGSEDVETFKSLLRKLRHEIESLNAKVILFTSPKKRDGKTFVMFSLSYVLSLIDKRVLIIDTNFKNNSLSQILGRSQSDLKVMESKKSKLLSRAQGQEAKSTDTGFDSENSYDLINPTKYKNIYIVGNAGGGTESPAEILTGRDFSNLITMLADSFDYILLEGAALNDYSDTKELVRYADKVVAVFSAETGIKQQDRESIHYLKSLGKKFGGVVLNRINTKDLKL